MTTGGGAAQVRSYRSLLVRGALREIHAAGHDVAEVTARYRMSSDALVEAATPIGIDAGRRFMAECAERVGVPSLGVHLAQKVPRGFLGVVDHCAGAARTLREAARCIAKYIALVTPVFRAELEETSRAVTLRQWIDGEPTAQGAHSNEFVPAMMVRHVRELVGETAEVDEVMFAHPRPRDVSHLIEFFGPTRLRFGTGVNGMVVRRELADRAQLTANPALATVLDQYAERMLENVDETALATDLRRAIRANLTYPQALLPRVAEVCGTTPRTLQRHLRASGVSFRALVEDVRREATVELRAGGSAMGAIADVLGYAERSSLSRAARRWSRRPGAK